PMLADGERRALLGEWSGTESPFPRTTIDQLFAEHAAATPDAVAVEAAGARMTYGELAARSNRLARHLRGLGVRPGMRVGICLDRSPEMVTAILATLAAGGAYVPLDPGYPAERLAFMLADTAAAVVVTDSRLAAGLPPHAARTVLVDAEADAIAAASAEPLEAGTAPDAPACVMYTSGSTGRPKGIEVPHRAVVRLVRGTDFIDIRPDDVFLQMAPAAFDAATLELWGPLLNGARVALYPPEAPSVEGIERAVAEHGVTVLWLTAGLFHLVVDERIGALRGVRQLLAGGDVLSVPHVRRVLAELPGTVFINGYGPTENTTFTACHRVAALPEGAASVPIGRPIANTRVYVLDGRMEPVPVGVPGELYTGGAGLALGYLNRPALTAEAFVPSPFGDGERLYRTGDRVRWTEVRECESAKVRKWNGDEASEASDGSTLALSHSRTFALEFLGRVDAQVKVRGFRIEPGEIEAALRAHPRVSDAAVVAREDRGQARRLVAYVASPEGEELAPALREHLRATLPEHMVPAAVVVLDRLPLTANGKVDARALPAPEVEHAQGPDAAPRDETERLLVDLLASVLAVEDVGIHDNFFALGGDSILCIQLVSRARAAGLPLATRDVFLQQTAAAMADHVRTLAPPIADVPDAPDTAGPSDDEMDEILYALGQAGESE
ncbi:MAG TPA: non-ribosomal peptide synthetase, partial [Longimicrobium sp.]|nr:non-ribosomal peptide synthetase [Longimicrobium sp.]